MSGGPHIGSCATCTGRCCYDVVVRISGHDAWRIRAAQRLEYRDFVDVLDDPEPSDDSFALGERRCGLYLAKNAAIPQTCTFLMHLPADVQRCGIYADRPLVCAVYPMMLSASSVDVRRDVRCKPDDWNLATIDFVAWRDRLLEYAFERALFAQIAQHWNATLPAQDDPGRFFAYLDAVVPAIEAARNALEPSIRRRLVAGRPLPPREEDEAHRSEFARRVEDVCAEALAATAIPTR